MPRFHEAMAQQAVQAAPRARNLVDVFTQWLFRELILHKR